MGGARRRLVVLSCAVFAVLLGAVPLVRTASASAHAEQINGTATCEQDGTYTVEWTIAGLAAAETVTPVSVGPASRQLTPDTLQLAADTDGSFVESGIPADSGRAVVILSVLSGVGGSPQAAPSAAPSASSTEGPAAARGGLLRGQVDLDPGCAPSGADAQVVRAVPVEFTDAACTAGIASDPSYTIPSVPGVQYELAAAPGQVAAPLAPGAHSADSGSTVTVTASALPGYRLSHTATYAHHFGPVPLCSTNVPVHADPPRFHDATCTGGKLDPATYQIPRLTGVVYSVNGAVVAAGTYPAAGGRAVTVIAAADAQHALVGPTSFSHHFVADPTCTSAVTVRAQSPTFTDPRCVEGQLQHATYTIPAQPGVEFDIDATPVAAGTYPVAGGLHVSIVARAAAHFVLQGASRFAHTFSTDPTCQVSVVPAPPTFAHSACSGGKVVGASYTVPAVDGVTYLVDGEPVDAGTHQAADDATVVVTAQAEPGYVLSGIDTFSHTFPAAATCPVAVQGAAPLFIDAACGSSLAAGSYLIPKARGVEYEVGARVVPAGTHVVGPAASLTVTAKALPGYVLRGANRWSHAFAHLLACSGSVIAAPVEFVDDLCVDHRPAGATYTIPTSRGVTYGVGSTTLPAGTYPAVDGSTITVVAKAEPGYTLAGITQWTHTFAPRPVDCSRSGGGPTHTPKPTAHPTTPSSSVGTATAGPPRSSSSTASPAAPNGSKSHDQNSAGTPAYTGVPVAQTLLAGIALIAAGLALHLAASSRRRGRRAR